MTGLLTLVDAAMIDQDYDGGRQIVPTMQYNVQNQRRDTTNLLVEQVLFCSHVLLSKIDRVAESKVLPVVVLCHGCDVLWRVHQPHLHRDLALELDEGDGAVLAQHHVLEVAVTGGEEQVEDG